jgi:hypothetical protein
MENTGDLLYSQLAKLENWLWCIYLFLFFLQASIANRVTFIFGLIVSHNNN